MNTRSKLIRTTEAVPVGGDDPYRFENGWVMERGGVKTTNDNLFTGWVLRDAHGNVLDYDRFRNDLAERHGLDLYTSVGESRA